MEPVLSFVSVGGIPKFKEATEGIIGHIKGFRTGTRQVLLLIARVIFWYMMMNGLLSRVIRSYSWSTIFMPV